MSFSATQALMLDLFIVSRLGFHVPPPPRAQDAAPAARLKWLRWGDFVSVPPGQRLFVCLAEAVAFSTACG